MRDGTELHALEPEDFEREVRSFEHWFGAVEDYLTGLEGGHRTDLMDASLTRVSIDASPSCGPIFSKPSGSYFVE